MTVQIQTATVYFGGRRRWFSLDAAFRAEARKIIKQEGDTDLHDGDYIREVSKLAAIARAEFEQQPVPAPAAAEARALAACRELVAAQAEVKRITKEISSGLSACYDTWAQSQQSPDFEFDNYKSHLEQAYAPEVVENDNFPGTHKEWNSQHLLDDCPHCLAAHNAIQQRKLARKRLGAARRAVTMIGRAP